MIKSFIKIKYQIFGFLLIEWFVLESENDLVALFSIAYSLNINKSVTDYEDFRLKSKTVRGKRSESKKSTPRQEEQENNSPSSNKSKKKSSNNEDVFSKKFISNSFILIVEVS